MKDKYFIYLSYILFFLIIFFPLSRITSSKNHKCIDIINIKIYYINLARRKERNIKIIDQLNKSILLNNRFIRFNAIDGNFLKNKYRINDFEKKRGWIGCALSHILIWEKVCKTNKYHLIFEDDIFLKNNFDKNFKNVLDNLPLNFDIIYLLTVKYVIKADYNKYYYKIKDKNFGLTGYLISPKGACKLLKKIKPYNSRKQIDSWIVENTRNGYLNNYLCKAPLIWTFQDIYSDVQTDIKKIRYHGKPDTPSGLESLL